MRRWFFVFSFLIAGLPLGWGDPIQEDPYFQEVTTEAWRRYDQAQKKSFATNAVEISNPDELKIEFQKGVRWEGKRDYKKAAKAYVRALSYAPLYPASADLLWRLAQCYEKQYRWVDAFETYADLYQKYPAYDLAIAAPQRQFRVARILARGKEKVVLSYATDQFYIDIAKELYEKLQKQIPKTELAGVCQFEIGNIDKKKKDFRAASEAYYEVILNYPLHPLVPRALFESGLSASRAVRGASYDAHSINLVIKRFRQFIKKYPTDEKVSVAQKILSEMEELQAEKLFETAQFYLKQGDRQAAHIYFHELRKEYPNSLWAKNLKQTARE